MKISNSQILSFQKCQRRFYYEHMLKLKPLEYPEPMRKGLDGHTLMETALLAMQEGASYEEAVATMNPILMEFMAEEKPGLQIYRHCLALLARIYREGWKPVHVEQSLLYMQKDGHEYAFTPDFVFEFTDGLKRGELGMLDFKFTGQYWTDREIGVYQQIPKYIEYYKEFGLTIRRGAVVMLNTRATNTATGDQLFQIKWLDLNKEKLRQIRRENEELVSEVVEAKSWPQEKFKRTVDTFQCKMCIFGDDLCPAELSGRPIEKLIKMHYEINTYFDDNYENGGSPHGEGKMG